MIYKKGLKNKDIIGWFKTHKMWVFLALLAIAIKIFSFFPSLVENFYSRSIYPATSKVLRTIFGWIPFSVGDVVYLAVIFMLLHYIIKLVRHLFAKKEIKKLAYKMAVRLIKLSLICYVLFYALWGLNYNRQPVSYSMGIDRVSVARADLDTVIQIITSRLSSLAYIMDTVKGDVYVKGKEAFKTAVQSYMELPGGSFSFNCRPASVKATFFGKVGNLMGFMGYYNPFTGEAQVNTTIPAYLHGFVTSHEVAHQLGFAKENEANIVGFLGSHRSHSTALRYSCYMDMYTYAWRQLYQIDSAAARAYFKQLPVRCKNDIEEYKVFLQKNKNFLDEITLTIYDYFLKANEQPAGMETYNHVVEFLIGYMKKFGTSAL